MSEKYRSRAQTAIRPCPCPLCFIPLCLVVPLFIYIYFFFDAYATRKPFRTHSEKAQTNSRTRNWGEVVSGSLGWVNAALIVARSSRSSVSNRDPFWIPESLPRFQCHLLLALSPVLGAICLTKWSTYAGAHKSLPKNSWEQSYTQRNSMQYIYIYIF